LFVKARIVGNVNHPSLAEEGAVAVDDWVTIVAMLPISFKKVEHSYHIEFPGQRRERVRYRTRHRLGQPCYCSLGRVLWIKRFKSQFGKADEPSPGGRRGLKGLEASLYVGHLIVAGELLNQGDS
jgi:hypothetical protein